MKKILVILSLATIFIFNSCSKQVKEQVAVDTQKVEEVLNFKGDPGSRVIAFSILSAEEKVYAFKKHIQDNYEKLNLNKKQIDIVKKAIDIIVPEMYLKASRENYSKAIAEFAHEATELFSVKDYIYLFQNIQTFEKIPSPVASINAPGSGECFCKWDSSCSAYAETKGPDCITGQNGCRPTDGGCGWFWLFDCTGDCGRK
jgi:hypothetical protein